MMFLRWDGRCWSLSGDEPNDCKLLIDACKPHSLLFTLIPVLSIWLFSVLSSHHILLNTTALHYYSSDCCQGSSVGLSTTNIWWLDCKLHALLTLYMYNHFMMVRRMCYQPPPALRLLMVTRCNNFTRWPWTIDMKLARQWFVYSRTIYYTDLFYRLFRSGLCVVCFYWNDNVVFYIMDTSWTDISNCKFIPFSSGNPTQLWARCFKFLHSCQTQIIDSTM